jgi:CubicO group peptidase (beta-lactamase class C family)
MSHTSPRRLAAVLGVAASLCVAAFTLMPCAAGAADQPNATTIAAIVRTSMAEKHLKAAIVEVRSGGAVVYRGALGESMTGVPATADMHFRNGALAFTYMATLLLEFVDQQKTTLDTKLSAYFPDLPNASAVSLRNLAQMTSGYVDYVYTPELLDGYFGNPFRQWTPEELIHIGVGKPMEFAPGTNWGYSHTNYVILGLVLQKIAGMPLADALAKDVIGPMGLTNTTQSTTPAIPEPVLHAFTSERREQLGIKPGVAFYEEGTYWNPSWTTVAGAVETTDIDDLSASIEAVAAGKLLSEGSRKAMLAPSLIGFGHKAPNCHACMPMTKAFNYGLGIINAGPWITQTLGFSGASGTVAYLPQQKLTIAVEVTNGPEAYDAQGNAGLLAADVARAVGDALAPGTMPQPSN